MSDKQSLVKLGMIIQHLQQIKKWIELEEMEEIDEEIDEIQKLSPDEEVQHIIHLLQLGLYQAAIPAIEECRARFGALVQGYMDSHLGIIWRK
jgi:hypothetical protein